MISTLWLRSVQHAHCQQIEACLMIILSAFERMLVLVIGMTGLIGLKNLHASSQGIWATQNVPSAVNATTIDRILIISRPLNLHCHRKLDYRASDPERVYHSPNVEWCEELLCYELNWLPRNVFNILFLASAGKTKIPGLGQRSAVSCSFPILSNGKSV